MTLKTVGIISAGDMGAGIGGVLGANGLDVITPLDGRSKLTHTRATEAGMRDVGSVDNLVREADLVISVLVPAQATSIAQKTADAMGRTGAKPTYADCNAVAPKTVEGISEIIGATGASFIDAGIIGSPPPGRSRFHCSGPDTSLFEELAGHGLKVLRVGPTIGQASGLKMAYGASTKGAWALWIELLTAARALGLSDALMAEFGAGNETVNNHYTSGVTDAPRRVRRWVDEMEEIGSTFESVGLTPKLMAGVAEMFRFVGETHLGDQTSREPNPELDTMLDVLVEHARSRGKQA
jgi:3-hydroxyisobutyrate dehydrogenase-like beta-hydroxyacid dehydrogenase